MGADEFLPDAGVAVYRRGTITSCSATGACAVQWGNEEVRYVAAPRVTADYRLRVGPIVSDIVTISVDSSIPRNDCRRLRPNENPPEARRRLEITPERSRIVYGETVRLRGLFAFESCSGLLRPRALPSMESRRATASYPDQPAQHVVSGPTRDSAGDLIYEVAPPSTTAYRLFFAEHFGEFATIEVAPSLDLRLKMRTGPNRVVLHLQATAGRSLRGARVVLERQHGAAWRPVKAIRLGSGSHRDTEIHVSVGELRIRARMPAPGSDYVEATSAPLTLNGP